MLLSLNFDVPRSKTTNDRINTAASTIHASGRQKAFTTAITFIYIYPDICAAGTLLCNGQKGKETWLTNITIA